MIKIGILGTDNSHAREFAKLANLKKSTNPLFNDIRVTHIYGHDESETKKLQEECGVDVIAGSAQQLIDAVDAVMVVFRDGKLHYEYASAAIEKGLPVWVDKPITIDPSECGQLIEQSNRKNTVLMGGSNCKYAADLIHIKNYYLNNKSKILSATINFPIYVDSVYSGMYFYAPHLVEMTTEIFGFDIKSIFAHQNGANINAMLSYDDIDVNLCFSAGAQRFSCYFVGINENIAFNIDITDIAEAGFENFIVAVKTKKQSREKKDMLAVTTIVAAIDKAARTGIAQI